MTTSWPNPALPGSNPDPSIVLVDGWYYVVTSTFEYLPALPVYRSRDLVTWEHIGNVAERPEQAGLDNVPTPGGVWAPTIRHHDGRFHVIVSIFLGGRGCVVFTATDPAGPWDDGVVIAGVDGIDPDLAWDDEGTAYVTYAAFGLGIVQVRVDLASGATLEQPRRIWSGTGLLAPEGPHLYRREGLWYLLIAEGGTDRGHAVSVARGPSPSGPFEGCPDNPVLSTRSTAHPVQNVGHADLVEAPGGGTAMVMLGVRPVDAALSFSPLGRETFVTSVAWHDGWPRPVLPPVGPGAAREQLRVDLTDPHLLSDPGWLAVRRTPRQVATVREPGILSIAGDASVTSAVPAFLGRRQRHHDSVFYAVVDAREGAGGVASRLREDHLVVVEVADDGSSAEVTARAVLAGIEQTWSAVFPSGSTRVAIETEILPVDLSRGMLGGEVVRLVVGVGSERTVMCELDGRYWSYETAKAFTGRVVGLFASRGRVDFLEIGYDGAAGTAAPDPTMFGGSDEVHSDG